MIYSTFDGVIKSSFPHSLAYRCSSYTLWTLVLPKLYYQRFSDHMLEAERLQIWEFYIIFIWARLQSFVQTASTFWLVSTGSKLLNHWSWLFSFSSTTCYICYHQHH